MTDTAPATLTIGQRRLVTGIAVIAGATTMVSAAYNYILDPMLDALDATQTQGSLLRQLPSIAALLVVFLAGVLGDRFGDRRVLFAAAGLFSIGSLLVSIAPVFGIAALGMVVQSIGTSITFVVALGLLSARISDPGGRASAFSVFAIVSPVVYLILPVVAGALVDNRTWRLVPLIWTVGGLVMLWSCWRLLPADEEVRGGGELVTPFIAGLVLAAGVQTINSASSSGVTSRDTLIRLALTVAGLVVLAILFRRITPSLSLAALRRGGMLILLTVVLLVPFANLWFYATMGYQYVFGLDTLQTALAMAPAQIGAIAGAVVTRKVLQRKGVPFTGTALLLAFAVSLLPVLLISVDSPLWVPILVFGLYAAAFTGASIPITNAIMNTAPRGEEGSASAFRSASGHLGSAVGVVFTTAVLATAVTASLDAQLSAQGMDSQQSTQIAEGIIDGATSEDLSAQYSVPVDDVDMIGDDLSVAMVDGLHLVAVSGSVIALLCAGAFRVAVRRQVHDA